MSKTESLSLPKGTTSALLVTYGERNGNDVKDVQIQAYTDVVLDGDPDLDQIINLGPFDVPEVELPAFLASVSSLGGAAMRFAAKRR